VIKEVALHRARLAPGWVTVLGRVNHLGAEPAIQIYSAWLSFVDRRIEYQRKLGELTGTPYDALARVRNLAVLAGASLRTRQTEISAEVREAVDYQRCVRGGALYKYSLLYFFLS